MHDHTPGPGPNANRPLQWQTPHRPDHAGEPPEQAAEPDLDLVEAAFIEGFEGASDPTSFLRLAGVPFTCERDGQILQLVRVQLESRTDVASVTPLLGGQGHRVAPLPASHVAKRRSLGFDYLTGNDRVQMTLAEARALADITPPR